jgi:asparagine synthase (glutamine-hydrolysing)
MGVKPFFFKQIQSGIVFASEIKSLFRNPLCPAKIDKKGLNEIFLLSPGRIPGGAVYKDIKELRPGEYLVADKKGIRKKQYFKIMARPHTEDYNETKTHLRELVTDSIKRQLVSDVPLACFLSGGLDSSLISYIKSTSGTNTETFSVDFVDNDKNFTRNDFQPDTDTKYINIMKDFAKTDHKFVTLENDKVVAALREAALARDLPGMADVDASLLLFCGEVKKTHTVCLSGECADELFGGYPWYFTPQDPNTFPWSRSLEMRKNLLNKKYLTKSPEQFVKKLIDETAKKTSVLESDFESDKAARRMFMLNVQWFMQTLLDRKDRMSMYNGLEVRVPFCDKRLVEYAFNIPWSLKSLNGREKGLLREAFRGILPDEIVLRKKSPYPKTFDPEFLKSVRDLATQAVNRGGLVSQIINKEYFDMLRNLEYESSGGASPWYGQLMRLPQVYAWIYQMDVIFNEYNVKLV